MRRRCPREAIGAPAPSARDRRDPRRRDQDLQPQLVDAVEDRRLRRPAGADPRQHRPGLGRCRRRHLGVERQPFGAVSRGADVLTHHQVACSPSAQLVAVADQLRRRPVRAGRAASGRSPTRTSARRWAGARRSRFALRRLPAIVWARILSGFLVRPRRDPLRHSRASTSTSPSRSPSRFCWSKEPGRGRALGRSRELVTGRWWARAAASRSSATSSSRS